MKKGDLLNGLAVVDVKRVNKLNLIQFLKDVNSYLELGYKIDVNSGRQVGLVLQCDVYKLESASNVASTKSDEVRQEGVEKSVEEAKQALDTFTTPEQNDAKVAKTTRAKKTT